MLLSFVFRPEDPYIQAPGPFSISEAYIALYLLILAYKGYYKKSIVPPWVERIRGGGAYLGKYGRRYVLERLEGLILFGNSRVGSYSRRA